MSIVDQASTRAEWLEARKSAIGASDVAAILGVSPWASAWEVWAEKTDRLEPWKGNEATRAGQAFENAVLDQAENELGTLERNVRVVHESLPMAATLDARVVSDGIPIEAKTTGLTGRVYGDWGDALTDQVPDYYLVQVHAQLCVTGAELAYLFALIAGRGVVKFQIERSDKLCEQLSKKCKDWWHQHITLDQEPSRERTPDLDVIKRFRRVPKKSVQLDAETQKLISHFQGLKLAEKSIKDELKEAESKILLALGDAEGATYEGGSLTYYETSRKGYEVKPCTYRTLRIKESK